MIDLYVCVVVEGADGLLIPRLVGVCLQFIVKTGEVGVFDEFDLRNVDLGESDALRTLITLEHDRNGDHEVGHCHGIDNITIFGWIEWYEHLRIRDKLFAEFTIIMSVHGNAALIVILYAVGKELGVEVILDNRRLFHDSQLGYCRYGELVARLWHDGECGTFVQHQHPTVVVGIAYRAVDVDTVVDDKLHTVDVVINVFVDTYFDGSGIEERNQTDAVFVERGGYDVVAILRNFNDLAGAQQVFLRDIDDGVFSQTDTS